MRYHMKHIERFFKHNSDPGELPEEPFLIRPHHAARYKDLSRKSPKRNARFSRNVISQGYETYVEDVVGTTDEDQNVFERALTDVYVRYKNLPETHQIKLVPGQKDEICGTCILGKHCTMNDQYEFTPPFVGLLDEPDATKKDTKILFAIKEKAEKMGKPVQEVQETAIFLDAEPKDVVSLLINAGDLKKVLRKIPTYKIR